MSDYCAIIRTVNNHTLIFCLPLYIEFSSFQIQAKRMNLAMCHMFGYISLQGKPAFGSSQHKKYVLQHCLSPTVLKFKQRRLEDYYSYHLGYNAM
jgi:hypothetical protein